MSEERPLDGGDYLSAKDIAQWAEQEIEEAAKAFQLRTRELSELARAYSAGEINPQQADAMHSRYFHRWGESLPGVTLGPTITDQQIIAGIDEAAQSARGAFNPTAEGPTIHSDRLLVKSTRRQSVRE